MLNKSILICPVCNQAFTCKPSVASVRVHCSTECAAQAKRNRVIRTCEYCGCQFSAAPSQIKRGNARFCSRECGHANRRMRESRACLQCGQEFIVRPADARNRRSEFCSRLCWDTHREGVTISCLICGNAFYIPRKLIGKRRYCSYACTHAARRIASRKDRGSFAYQEWRAAVLERDGYTCQRCGAKPIVVHAHHIRQWLYHSDERFNVANGITLCAPCHHAHHGWLRRKQHLVPVQLRLPI
jgi:hypothetical protein